MTEKKFIELLDRYEKGLCTPDEKVRLEQWLDNMKGGERPFQSAAERDVVKSALHESVYRKAGISAGKTRMLIPFLMKIAASILIVVSVGYATLRSGLVKIGTQDVAVEVQARNAVEKVIMSDGSIVWLKPGARISYPDKFEGNERVVTLVGEALFEVAKDPAHPFIIHTGDLRTTVLGTSFNIKNTIDHTEVYVLTGRVSVTLAKTNQQKELLPSEKVLYSHASKQFLEAETAIEAEVVEEYIKGTQYNMSFEDTKVRDIATRIQDKFSVAVTVIGDIDSCVITADFTDQSLNSTLDMIAEALNAKYNIDGNHVVLTGDGCE